MKRSAEISLDSSMQRVATASKRRSTMPSTTSEQIMIQQASAPARDNLMSLKVHSMLEEISCMQLYESKKLALFIFKLTDTLRHCLTQSKPLTETDTYLEAIPSFALLLEKCGFDIVDLKSSFEGLLEVQLIGSFDLHTSTFPHVNIDLCVTLPSDVLQPKDFLNFEYHRKRVALLLHLALHLQSKACAHLVKQGSVLPAAFKGDPRKPLIILTPLLNLKAVPAIRIFIAAPSGVFELSRLLPSKNNMTQTPLGGPDGDLERRRRAVAEYNATVTEDLSIIPQHRLLKALLDPTLVPHGRSAVQLMKIWLTQRELRWAPDSLDGHAAALLVAMLLHNGQCAYSSPPLTIFQTAIRLIAEEDWLRADICPRFNVEAHMDSTTRIRTCYPVCLLHPLTGKKSELSEHNCLWRMSEGAYHRLRDEAGRTHTLLLRGDARDFEDTFLAKSSFFRHFDLYYHIPLAAQTPSQLHILDSFAKCTAGGLATSSHFSLSHAHSHLNAIVTRALPAGDRVTRLGSQVVVQAASSDGVDSGEAGYSAHPLLLNGDRLGASAGVSLCVGLSLHPENSVRRVDRGPEPNRDQGPEEGEESEFKRFWGPRCELRRFKDGAIVEALVWDASSSGGRGMGEAVVESILRYILGRHMSAYCNPDGARVTVAGCRLERMLPGGDAYTESHNTEVRNATVDPRVVVGTSSLCQRVVTCVDQLRSLLTSRLKGLPLIIDSLVCVDPSARYTALYPPLPHPFFEPGPPYTSGDPALLHQLSGRTVSLVLRSVPVHALFGHSGRWPDDPEARIHTLTAFAVAIAEQLKKQFKIRAIAQSASVDVFIQGLILRVYLHPQQQTGAAEVSPHSDEHPYTLYEGLSPTSEYSLRSVRHHQAMRALLSRCPALADCTRLLRLWIDSHALSGHVTQRTLELLCAHTFLNPESTSTTPAGSVGSITGSPATGLAITLNRLATHDWSLESMSVIFTTDSETDASSQLIQLNVHGSTHEHSRSDSGKHTQGCLRFSVRYSPSPSQPPEEHAEPLDPALLPLLLACAKHSAEQYSATLRSAYTQSRDIVDVDAALLQPPPCLHPFRGCGLLLKFDASLLCTASRASMDDVARGPFAAQTRIFANVGTRETNIRNLIVSECDGAYPIQTLVVQRLREAFGSHAMFFWDAGRGNQVGVAWRPRLYLPQTLSVLGARYKLPISFPPVSENGSLEGMPVVVTNAIQLIAEMVALGDGLIVEFELL